MGHLVIAATALALLLSTLGGAAAQAPVTLNDATGTPVARAERRGESVAVRSGTDQPLGEIKIESDRVKLRDAGGVERWKVKRKDYGAEIEDGGGQRLFRIRKSGTDEWKLEDASKTVLARVKPKDTGYEVRDAAGATIAKVKRRQGRLVFESEAGARLGELAGTDDARAGLWFALPRFSPLERAALWAFFANVLK